MATVSFKRQIGVLEEKNLTFCLGEVTLELSLAEFVMRTEIYLSSEVHIESYLEFIARCSLTTDEFKDETYWPKIAHGTYSSGIEQESDILSRIHRLLHRLITNSINQR